MRPRPPLRRRKPWATLVALLGTALVALGAIIGWGARKTTPPVTLATPGDRAAKPEQAPAPKGLDADEAFDRARAEALRWSSEAMLTALEAGPFVGGQLATDGKLRAEFGRPAGAHVGPGAGVQREVLVVTASTSGLSHTTRSAPGALGIADPNCIFQDVWRKTLPAIDKSARLNLRYELSSADKRFVWKILPEDGGSALRIVDGANCTFLVR
ncbi:MAG TPA: hypothetical protein VGP93_13295 [Polyangiaceae bacterium]|jgi:hypothetical protein|nr:hypothetical protein [Polyangiaceae bacterium]